MLTLVDDETDKKSLLEELRHAQRMEVIGQLSSSVAHDFNNLLTLISGYAELLATEVGESPRATQLVKDIQVTTTRASTLTGKLLTMGRSKVPAPVVFAPAATVRSLAEVLDRIVGSSISVTLALDAAAGNVRADPDQFEQMVINLAVNARDAMAEGGELRIAVGSVAVAGAPGPLEVEPGDYVELTVADTGAGMDEATAERCFEPLFTTKGPGKGTGLGLPAARRVVIEAGGAIGVASAPGEGTTFRDPAARRRRAGRPARGRRVGGLPEADRHGPARRGRGRDPPARRARLGPRRVRGARGRQRRGRPRGRRRRTRRDRPARQRRGDGRDVRPRARRAAPGRAARPARRAGLGERRVLGPRGPRPGQRVVPRQAVPAEPAGRGGPRPARRESAGGA